MTDPYDLKPLQDWYLARKPSLTFACEDMGYWRNGRKPDTSRVLRDLGLKDEGRRSGAHVRRQTSYAKAVRLARALGADPLDVGL